MIQTQNIEQIIKRVKDGSVVLQSEEATKHALIMPVLSALGYDVFDPSEIVPEFTADYGIKVGEKIDYAIMVQRKPAILIECKSFGTALDIGRVAQLGRYFAVVSDARIGVLTNGGKWMFFTDLKQTNIMDSKPFLVVDLMSSDVSDYAELLQHFAKDTFDPDVVYGSALNVHYISEMQNLLAEFYVDPPADFVRLIAKRVYSGTLNSSRLTKFTQLTKVAFQSFVDSRTDNKTDDCSKYDESYLYRDVPKQATPSTSKSKYSLDVLMGVTLLHRDGFILSEIGKYYSLSGDTADRLGASATNRKRGLIDYCEKHDLNIEDELQKYLEQQHNSGKWLNVTYRDSRAYGIPGWRSIGELD